MLSIKLFGGFQLSIDGQPISISKPRQREILAYLALKYPASVSRESLATQLWMESNDSQASTNLRGHLLKLRKEFPQLDPYLDLEGSLLSWKAGAEVQCDVLEFKKYLQNAAQGGDESFVHNELERAAELYEGALFPENYSDWTFEERERLRDTFVDLLERLGVLHESLRLYKEAILYVRRLLRFEPQREEGYRLMMRLHAMLGEFDEIRRVYQQCEQVLQKEFELPPSKPTKELYQRLLQSGETVQHTPLARIPMVARDGQWQKLQRCWTTVLSRGAHCVLIEGELGIGKSRLLDEMAETLLRRGFTVLPISCRYFDQNASYTPVRHWLQNDLIRANLRLLDATQRRALAPLLPEAAHALVSHLHHETVSPALERSHLHEALSQLFLAKQMPLLLVIDNLHWCDAETLEWLHSFLTHDPRAPVMLLGATCSAYPHQPQLASWRSTLRQQGILTEITLPPLTLSETHALATKAIAGQGDHSAADGEDPSREDPANPQIDSEEAALLHRLSSGNPAHILDLLNSQTRLSAAYAEQLQQSLYAVYDLLLAHLPADALELVECAAMVGTTATFTQLLHAIRIEEEQLLLSLSLLVDSCILRELSDESYQFTSHFLPQLVLQRMNGTKQRYWRSRLAR